MTAFSSTSSVGRLARWTRFADDRAEPVPRVAYLGEHPFRFRIVRDRARQRPREHQVGLLEPRPSGRTRAGRRADPSAGPTARPARQRDAGGIAASSNMSARWVTRPGAPSERTKVGFPRADGSATRAACRIASRCATWSSTFLSESGSMHGGISATTVPSSPSHTCAARENVTALAAGEARAQEVPRGPRDVVRRVGADVARPDHGRTELRERVHQTDRLWVVHDRDVARPHVPAEHVHVARRHRVDVPALASRERTAVPEIAVEAVVDALRDVEEGPVALEHEPPRVDRAVPQVAEARAEQLRDAASLGGGVDVPERPSGHPRGAVVEARGGSGAARSASSSSANPSSDRGTTGTSCRAASSLRRPCPSATLPVVRVGAGTAALDAR